MKKKNKNQKTLPLNVQGYSLVIDRNSLLNNSNLTLTFATMNSSMACVYREGEKNAIFGTTFHDKVSDGEILDWANKKLDKHLSGSEDIELLDICKQII